MEKIKLSIIIAVYNEINTILEVIKRVQNEKHEKEIIIVDDGSTDGTVDLLYRLKNKNIKVIFNKTNRGKGYAIREGIRHVSGDIVIIQDADLEYYPDEYSILIEKIVREKADVVYGTRFLGTHRVFYFYHYLGNQILNLFANIILNANLSDLMTGFKAFRADTLKKFILKANRFGIEAEITAEVFRRKLRVYEVPISYEGRSYEEGKKIKWRDFFDCLCWLIRPIFRNLDFSTETLLRTQYMHNYNLQIYNKIKPFLGRRILEVGCGLGTISKLLVSPTKYLILLDKNDTYLKYVNERFIGNPFIRTVNMDLDNLDKTAFTEKFDTIVLINVLEHIENDADLLKNLKDLLTEQGRLLISTPAHRILLGSLDANLGHYRRYSKEELLSKLKKANFIIEKIEYMNSLLAIGWFINFRILRRTHMPLIQISMADKLIPLISGLEKFVRFPFGLTLFAVARNK